MSYLNLNDKYIKNDITKDIDKVIEAFGGLDFYDQLNDDEKSIEKPINTLKRCLNSLELLNSDSIIMQDDLNGKELTDSQKDFLREEYENSIKLINEVKKLTEEKKFDNNEAFLNASKALSELDISSKLNKELDDIYKDLKIEKKDEVVEKDAIEIEHKVLKKEDQNLEQQKNEEAKNLEANKKEDEINIDLDREPTEEELKEFSDKLDKDSKYREKVEAAVGKVPKYNEEVVIEIEEDPKKPKMKEFSRAEKFVANLKKFFTAGRVDDFKTAEMEYKAKLEEYEAEHDLEVDFEEEPEVNEKNAELKEKYKEAKKQGLVDIKQAIDQKNKENEKQAEKAKNIDKEKLGDVLGGGGGSSQRDPNSDYESPRQKLNFAKWEAEDKLKEGLEKGDLNMVRDSLSKIVYCGYLERDFKKYGDEKIEESLKPSKLKKVEKEFREPINRLLKGMKMSELKELAGSYDLTKTIHETLGPKFVKATKDIAAEKKQAEIEEQKRIQAEKEAKIQKKKQVEEEKKKAAENKKKAAEDAAKKKQAEKLKKQQEKKSKNKDEKEEVMIEMRTLSF